MTQLTVEQRFAAANAQLPLVAILRGVTPDESVEIGRRLYDAGFRLIEVPLNSPDPFKSIAAIRRVLPQDALVGAGTVLTVDQVRELKDSGGELTVMPHADTTVIRAAKAAGMACTPGVATPTEAFAALQRAREADGMGGVAGAGDVDGPSGDEADREGEDA